MAGKLTYLRIVLCCIGLGTISLAVGGAGGCDNPPDCPAKADIHPGGSCGSSDLQCNYAVRRTDCDGVKSTVESSCLCQDGKWACPDDWTCEPPVGDGGEDADETASDADAPSDDTAEEAETADDVAPDAPADAPADTHD